MRDTPGSITILLVEDEALIAMSEAAVLENYGYEVIIAGTASEAIERVRDTEVDLILMDIDLGKGEMDGTDAAETILGEREVPIIFLTGHAEREMVERVKGITRYGYVLKNAGEFVLIESITMAFELFASHLKLVSENEERKRAEEYLKRRNDFIETIVDNLPIGLAINYIDEGRAVYMNEQFERIYGWPKEELTDIEDFFRLVYPDPAYREEIKRRVSSDIQSGDPERMRWEDIEITTREGEKRRITAANIPISDQNYMISVVQDVTEYRKALADRKRGEIFLTSTLNGLSAHIALVDAGGTIVFVNEAWRVFAEINGVSASSVSEGVNYLEVCDNAVGFSSENAQEFAEGIRAALRGDLDVFSLEYPCHSPEVERWFIGRVAPIRIEEQSHVVVSHTDITELRAAERILHKREEQYRLLTENSHDAIVYFDPEFNPLYMSPSTRMLFGYTPKELTRKKIFDMVHPEDRPGLEEKIRASIGEKTEERSTTCRIYTKTGELKWIEMTANHLYDEAEGLRGLIVNARDISERKGAEVDLQDALREKDDLMKELNHRVKNNLIMVKSLINLKDYSLSAEVDLSDLARQVDAIRIVHEKLYQTDDISHIPMREYFEYLLSTVFSFSPRSVVVEKDIEPEHLHSRTAVTLGLIVNEIATNAIKYGFTDDTEARFSVELREDRELDRYVLVLSNTGNHFPEHIHLENPETLGLRLITALVNQLRGTIELERSPNPVFTIRFPVVRSASALRP